MLPLAPVFLSYASYLSCDRSMSTGAIIMGRTVGTSGQSVSHSERTNQYSNPCGRRHPLAVALSPPHARPNMLQVAWSRNGAAVACGGNYSPGETLSLSLSSSSGQYVVEVTRPCLEHAQARTGTHSTAPCTLQICKLCVTQVSGGGSIAGGSTCSASRSRACYCSRIDSFQLDVA